MKKTSTDFGADNNPSARKTPFQRSASLTAINKGQERDPKQFSASKVQSKLPLFNSIKSNKIEIDKNQIVYYGLKFDKSQYINILNSGRDVIRINIGLPKTKYFQIYQEDKNFMLSAGMSRKICVNLNPKVLFDDKSYYDQIIIQTEKSKNVVKLQWFANEPTLKYTSLFDLNAIDIGKQQKCHVLFQNCSSNIEITKVKLVKDAWDNIQIYPDQFCLKPNQKIDVEIMVTPLNAGVYHHKIIIQADNSLLAPLQVIYSAIDFIYRIEDQEHDSIKQVNFGWLLKGMKKQIVIYARNNSPNEIQIKSKIKIGNNLRAESTLQSPQQLGIQCSSTVIELVTKNIKIKPFSRQRIILSTQTKVQESHKLMVDRFSKTESINSNLKPKIANEQNQHHEILVIQFSDVSKKYAEQSFIGLNCSKNIIVIPMRVIFTLPLLKILPNSLNLGKLNVGGTIRGVLSIQNISVQMGYHLSANKIFSVQCFLLKQYIDARHTVQLQVYLKGVNIGPFCTNIELVVAGIYPIKIPVHYQITNLQNSQINNREKLNKTGSLSLYNTSERNINFNSTLENVKMQKNRSKYENIHFRKIVSKVKSSVSVNQQFKQASTRNSIRNSSVKQKESSAKQNSTCENEAILPDNSKSSQIIQKKKYGLFVTKKIGKYFPFQELAQHKKLLKTKNTKDYFNTTIRRTPKNRKQLEEIQRELTPEQLKQISISEKIINFGRIFIKSRVQKEFVIGNNTQAAIIVQLQQTSNDTKKTSSLTETDFEAQIITPNGAARFKIVFNAQLCGKYSSILSYKINGTHTFQLLVQADIELVSLNISKSSLRMGYLDDVNQILLKDSFVLKNEGNIPATFSISQSNSRFIIEPQSGVIENGESTTVWVVQNNQNYPTIQAGESYSGKIATCKMFNNILFDERILIKIQDGNDISLRVTSMPGLSQPKCIVKESKIAYGCTIVSKSKSKTFQLKNLSRNLCLFQIVNQQCDQFLTFDIIKGRIPPQGSKQITVTYKSSIIHCITSNFQVLIRGGLIINVPIQAESIAPEVSVIENQFNFGQLCCDTAVVRPINIKNESQTVIQLFVDLRNNRQRGVQHLMISFWNSATIPLGQKVKISNLNYSRSASFQEEVVDNANKEATVHKIKIDARSIFTFYLVYKPTSAGYFEFILPVFLQNFIRNQSLTKVVSCIAIEPKFVIQPNIIRFKKKIINDKENSCFHPFVEYLTLRNPTDKILKWKLDVHEQHRPGVSISSYSSISILGPKSYKQPLAPKICFEIEDKKGQLKPKESISINVSFNPIEEGFYCHKIPLFIFSEEKGTYHQQAQIRLEGQGKYPSLIFNRKELIMPVVPLGIESIGMFEIHNEGYQSINLKHRFEIMDLEGNVHISRGNLSGINNLPQISLVFPEGSKMGMNKHKLYVIVKFISKKSVSFTCKLQLYDDLTDCRVYTLPISGTSDNSLLTTFSYLSDKQNIYRLQHFVPQSLEVKKNLFKGRIQEPIPVALPFSVVLKINDGRNIVDRYHSLYDDLNVESFNLDCQIIKRWMNNFFKEEKVRNFPNDLCQNPQILLKFLYKLTSKKQFDGNWQFQTEGSGKYLLNGQINHIVFYEQTLRILKTLGCLINHIRPYYLLEKDQFIAYMSKDPNWAIFSDYYIKNYELIYRQAWIIIFYQLILHFWCPKSKHDSSLKSVSNIYSNIELQIIRWIKEIYQQFNELQDSKNRFLSYGNDFKDCIALIFCLLKYSPDSRKIKALQNLNRKPLSSNEFSSNLKIFYQILDKLNILPLIYEDEFSSCKQKEIFLFLYQLYELLPQTLPKIPPIIFTCELGQVCSRVIDIKNPSNKTIHYWVKLQGSKDYNFEEKDLIVIEPKGLYQFKVEFKSRLSSEQNAVISFFSKQQTEVNSANGSAMVFELKSKIIGRKSIKKLQPIICPLYESTSIKIMVQNIFQDYELANFSINLIQQSQQQSNNKIKVFKEIKNKEQNNLAMSILNLQKDNLSQMPAAKPLQYYTQVDNIKIKKNSVSYFQFYYSPLKFAKSKCFLIFHDPAVGQFQYEIQGMPQIPKPLQEIKYQSTIYVGNKEQLQVNLPVYNSYLLKSQSLLEQRFSIGTHRKQAQKKSLQKFKVELNMDSKINQYVSIPSEVILKKFKKDASNVDFQNKIKFQYNFPHVLKDMTLDFLLIGDIKREIQDVRRFRVSLNIVHRPLQQELMMTTSARKSLVQQIPIENITNKDWKIKANIIQSQYSSFSLKQGEKCNLRQITVKKGQCQNLNICFEPKWLVKQSCKVSVHNTTTSQQLFFNIKGIVQEPLSQDHFNLKANNQQSTLFTITITNPYHQKVTYRIISDIDELKLPPEITLEASQVKQFNFIGQCIHNSPQIGYLKFIDQEGRFFWYSVTLECPQKKVRQFWVQMNTQVGKQIQKHVQFKNPYNKILHFQAQFPRQAGLDARQQFSIPPYSTFHYRIKFKPMKTFNNEVIIKAMNKQIGCFVYHTKLIAKEEVKIKIFFTSSEVGKVSTLQFKLQNNYRNPIKVNYLLTNEAIFQLDSPEYIAPNTEAICKLKFKPTAQGKQKCVLKVWGEHFPTKFFEVEGTGLAPYSIEVINFKAHVKQASMQIIKFVNPSPKKVMESVKVCLSQIEHGCFRIVNQEKGEIWQTQFKDLLIIPIQFVPQSKGYFQSVLTIQCFHFQWKYLLKGSTNFKQNEKINDEITTINKKQIIKLLKIPIPEYLQQKSNYFNKIQIEHNDKKLIKCLRQWMKLLLNNIRGTKQEQQQNEESQIIVYMKFKPKKVIKQVVKLVLFNSNEEGPKIYYNIQINVQDCGSENIITLQISTIKAINFDLSLQSFGLKHIGQIIRTKMIKGAYCEVEKLNETLRLKFKPNHLIFNKTKVYSDFLILESQFEEWNYEVQFVLKK